jgi:phosphoribosylformylglycinamidine synthase
MARKLAALPFRESARVAIFPQSEHSFAMKAKVFVMPKESVLDPQGAAVREAMQHLGFAAARDVRIGRYVEIDLAGDAATHEAKLRELCRDLLSNPVIEDYRLEMPNEKHSDVS